MGKIRTVAALDIGSSKVACFIAELNPMGSIRITGIKQMASAGIKNGLIVDVEPAFETISAVVAATEAMSVHMTAPLSHIAVSVNGHHLKSQLVHETMTIGGGVVRDDDVRHLIHKGVVGAQREMQGKSLLHAIPFGYTSDDTRGQNGSSKFIREPRGQHVEQLDMDMTLVTAHRTVLRNLTSCLSRAHLKISHMVAAPYASALACLVEDEISSHATAVIDMGAQTTSVALFYEGALVYTFCLPVGGQNVTRDIAHGLSTSIYHAERLKTLHGSALPSARDSKEMVDAPRVGENSHNRDNQVPKPYLISIIEPRIEEIFEQVRDKLIAFGADKIGVLRFILTGGASQLSGVLEQAERIFSRPVRLGEPREISGLAEAVTGPSFSTICGVLKFIADDQGEARYGLSSRSAKSLTKKQGPAILRWASWLRHNF